MKFDAAKQHIHTTAIMSNNCLRFTCWQIENVVSRPNPKLRWKQILYVEKVILWFQVRLLIFQHSYFTV